MSKRRRGFGKWRPAKRVTSRRKQLMQWGKKCFLDPNKRKPRYPVCKAGRVTCEGLLRAMQRAITQRSRSVARKARAAARRKGCRWAK